MTDSLKAPLVFCDESISIDCSFLHICRRGSWGISLVMMWLTCIIFICLFGNKDFLSNTFMLMDLVLVSKWDWFLSLCHAAHLMLTSLYRNRTETMTNSRCTDQTDCWVLKCDVTAKIFHLGRLFFYSLSGLFSHISGIPLIYLFFSIQTPCFTEVHH